MSNISGYSANIPIIPNVSATVDITTNVFQPVNTFFLESDTKIHDSINPVYIYNDSFISLTKPLDTILKSIKRDRIILIDEPINTSYDTYESALLYILKQLSTKINNVYIQNEKYLDDILKNVSNYKGLIKGIYTKVYGLCSNDTNDLMHLYPYYINLEVLQANTEKLAKQNMELVIQTNSICSKTPKVSNTFGSQLWLLDFLFQVSMGGARSVVIESTDANNIYAYNIFNQVTNGSQLYKGIVSPKIVGVSAYINKNNENGQTVIVINKGSQDIQLSIDLDTQYKGKIYLFNTNQLEDSEFGISYGEITYNSGAPFQMKTKESSTRLSGKNNVKTSENTYTFSIPKKSAVIMKASFNSQSGGAMFAQINNEDENETLVTARFNQLRDEYDSIPILTTVPKYKEMLSDL